MVAFGFGDFGNHIHEVDGLLEVFEGEQVGYFFVINNLPVQFKLLKKGLDFFGCEGWNAAAAGDAMLSS